MSVEVQEQPTMDVENVYARSNNNDNTSSSSQQTDAEMTDASKTNKATTAALDQSVLFSPQLLQMYYSRLFPYSLMHTWLSYGNKDPSIFSRREFSFTLDAPGGEEIYLRYQSFHNAEELQQAILSRRPAKIDIGAVFSHSPSLKNTLPESRFQPVQREFVLDVDLTDYDDIRKCGCTGAKICGTCWTFMQMAVKVMDEGLRQDFGFEHIAWFYSGRRGVHAWVCDETARMLSDEGRSAVASYFEVDLGSDRNKEVKLPYPLHPMLRRAFDILEPLFIESVLPENGHGLLARQEEWEALLDTLPEGAEKVKENVLKEWSTKAITPEEKWSFLKLNIDVFMNRKNNQPKSPKTFSPKEQIRLQCWPYEVVFRYTYPRLDINVSKKRNHLLKSPFCVHPKTGRVCVPFAAKTVDSFDPFTVPTLPQLMKEIDDYDKEHGEGKQSDSDKNNENKTRKIPNWKKTSLKEYYDPFVKDFLDPMQKQLRQQERDEGEAEAALTADF